jgi:zinc and cadmium transporter
MSPTAWLVVYCALILVGSLCGGYLPYFGQMTHNKLQIYLSAAAGVMLGASFFHVMPDAFEMAGPWFGWWMSAGVVILFCIERFIAPHSHEMAKENGHNHAHHDEHGCEHDHDHTEFAQTEAAGKGLHPAAPTVAGWMAVLGLTIHTFMNGVGLAGAVKADTDPDLVKVPVAWPGLALFLAIVLHKPADALAISTVLSRKGVSGRLISLVQVGFGLTVAAGVIAFSRIVNIEKHLENQITGAALAFSAGTFLFVALSDLLPEVQFHRHDRFRLFLALVSGVVLMGFIAVLEPHEHSEHAHNTAPAGDHAHHDHDEDHDHDQGEMHKHDH